MENPAYNRSTNSQGSVWAGLGLTVLLHLCQAPMGVVTGAISVLLIGVSQVLYMIPALVIVHSKGRTKTFNGLLIGAGITFLLNAACTGLVLFAVIRN